MGSKRTSRSQVRRDRTQKHLKRRDHKCQNPRLCDTTKSEECVVVKDQELQHFSTPSPFLGSRAYRSQNQLLFHPSFLPSLSRLCRSLTPLVSITTGQPHPAFPKTMLQYHLLVSTDLDHLAAHYHQTIPTVCESSKYPRRIPPWVDESGTSVMDIPVETKRRRIGRFIGLRGCESPDSEGMLESMEREWKDALDRRRADRCTDIQETLGRKV